MSRENPARGDAASAEMIRAYVQYKEDRFLKKATKDPPETNQKSSLRHSTSSSEIYVAPPICTELPPVLHIRRTSPLGRVKNDHQSRVAEEKIGPIKAKPIHQSSNVSDSESLKTPVIEAFTKNAAQFARQVELLNRNLIGRRSGPASSGDVGNGEKSRKKLRGDIRSRDTIDDLSDVLERDESVASSVRLPQNAGSIRTVQAENVRNRSHSQDSRMVFEGDVDFRGVGFIGSTRLLENVQKLQQVNDTLVLSLKKTIAAYKELSAERSEIETSYLRETAEKDRELKSKDQQLSELRTQMTTVTQQVEAFHSQHANDTTRAQVVEVKLSQAVHRIAKLQQENEDLKRTPRSQPKTSPSTEQALVRRVMELEAEAGRQRAKDTEIEELNIKLRAREAQVALLQRDQREPSSPRTLVERRPKMVERCTEMDPSSLQRTPDAEVKKLRESLQVAEDLRDELARELREVKHELEDRVWKAEKLHRDIDRLTKEKDRAYEKSQEIQQEYEEKRQQERKTSESRLDVLNEEMDVYKKRLKEAEKLLVKMKVRTEERDVAHRQTVLALKTRLDEVTASNAQYRERLEKINQELLAFDLPAESDGA